MKQHNVRLELASFFLMFWKDDAGKLAFRSWMRIQLRDLIFPCQVADIYEDSGWIQFTLCFCPTQAQNQYKSGAANNDFNFDFQHFLIISSCSHQIPYIPINQPANQPDQQENPLPANPSRDSPWPTHRIHPSSETKPVAPQLDVHEIRKMEKEAGRRPSCRVVSWWVGVFCYPP